jgi:hypothetical protein
MTSQRRDHLANALLFRRSQFLGGSKHVIVNCKGYAHEGSSFRASNINHQ